MNKNLVENISLRNPSLVVFGRNGLQKFVDDFLILGHKRLLLLTIKEIAPLYKGVVQQLEEQGISVLVNDEIKGEPSFNDYQNILAQANDYGADSVAGIGGGSVLDTAKLIAATVGKTIDFRQIIADNSLLKRDVFLACLPTTAGTGSEVSPNAIFFDPETELKIGVISPELVPDAAYVDPELTLGVPPKVTAATGIDALTHCIEAYVNNFAHPVVDLYALEGIRLIGKSLRAVIENGKDLQAREDVALGSMYGGMCLGPVNTAAVHALAYPLGSKYKIAHGVSNALLLPHVLEFNLSQEVDRYAEVAYALGVDDSLKGEKAAKAGIEVIRDMISDFGIPERLRDLNIATDDLEEMANSALKIQRLLKNNVREVMFEDALDIYKKAY